MRTRLLLALVGLFLPSRVLPNTLHYRYDFSRSWDKDRWLGEFLNVPGQPRVPVFYARILLPYGEELESIRFQAIPDLPGPRHGYPLAPVQRPVCPREQELKTRTSAEPLPAIFPPSHQGEPALVTKHGFQILYVALYPLQIFPATGETRRIPGGELDVDTRAARRLPLYRGLDRDRTDVAALLGSQRTDSEIFATYPRRRAEATLDYLVIAPQDLLADSDPNSLKRLLFEKTTRGIRTAAVSVEEVQSQYPGSDPQQKIRNAIIQYYKNQGLQYVLLVGNGYSSTPTKNLEVKLKDGTDGILPSDFYYACLDGDFTDTQQDLACEVAVGRAPVSTAAEMHAFVQKTILMEELDDDDPRLNRELNFGEMIDNQTLGSLSLEALLHGGSAGTLATEGYPASTDVQKLYETFDHQFSDSDVIQTINEGQFYTINHIGHANEIYCMRFYDTAIGQLNNDLPFFAITQGCYSGNLSRTNWASELLLSPTGGAGAIIANSNTGFYTSGTADGASNRLHLAFYDTVFRDGLRNLGKILFRAKEKLIPQVQQDPSMRWVSYETNLLGDPELELKLSR